MEACKEKIELLSNSLKRNDSSENIQIIKEDISELKNHAKARMRV